MEPIQFSFGSLIKHCRNLIRTGSFTQGRISRGEYIISYLIISLLGSIAGTLLRQLLGDTGAMISSLFGIVFGAFGIKLIIKRSHDITKSGWYYFRPVFVLIALLIVSGAYIITQGLFSIGENSPGINIAAIPNVFLRAGAIAFLATGIRLITTILMIFFKQGSIGKNQYGDDPLAHQPNSNGLYRGVGLSLLCISIITGSFGQPSLYEAYESNNGQYDITGSNSVIDTTPTSVQDQE